MNEYSWYSMLVKPSWAPPSFLFGPVWTFLYITILITFATVFWNVWQKKWPKTLLAPFILNLVFNFSFTPIQFGLQNNVLAAIDILLVLATLIWVMRAIWPKARWITYTLIPYLAWVSFATVLQLSITYLNW